MRVAAAGAGRDLPIVKETLGHAAIQTTMLYTTHVAPILQRKAADRMEDLLGCQEGCPEGEDGDDG